LELFIAPVCQDLLGWINLKPPSGLAANVGSAAV